MPLNAARVAATGALMCPPSSYTVRDVKNPFMRGTPAVDAARALEQWLALKHAFEAAGVEVLEIEAAADLEDMVFAANQAFVGSGSAHARFAVPSRMRYASRQREVPYYTRWFEQRGYEILDLGLSGAEYLEGHGDLLPHPGSALVWAGYGFRSSAGGVERFAAAMQAEAIAVMPLELIDETFYHLDTCFAPLNGEAALYHAPAFSLEARARLRAGWKRLYDVSREDAERFVCNGVAVNGAFVASYVPPALEPVLRDEGLQPTIVGLSEFEKGGGSAFCMKCFLEPHG